MLSLFFLRIKEAQQARRCRNPQLCKYTHSSAFCFFPSLPFIPFCSGLLFIPQHRTLQGSKEGFSWHGVNSDSEYSILESNQGGLGALEPFRSRRKSLPTPPSPTSPSGPLLGSCRSLTHSSTCLSLFKK